MRKVFKSFFKRSIGKRVLSMTLAFVMLFTMFAGQLPSGLLEVKAAESYDVTLHWQNANNWSSVYAWVWTSSSNYSGGSWPGAVAQEGANAGWHDYAVKGADSKDLMCIFSGDGSQTADISLSDALSANATDIWISGGKDNPTVSTTAPEGWVSSVVPEVVSPEVNGTSVTFRYYAPSASAVYLAGSMNGWSTTATPMTKGSNGVFEVTLTLEAGSYEYKFVADGGWYTDPNNTATSNGNSLVTVVDASVPTVVSPEVDGTSVTFRYYAPDATAVYLAGSMNGWSTTATSLTKGSNGVFEVTLDLEAGTYEYKFVVDGAWTNDPNNTNDKVGDNNTVTVVDESVPTVVSPEVDGFDVTFRYYAPDATTVCLAGAMNGWSGTATPMTKGDNGVFEVTLTLEAGSYEYKFVVDGASDWITDPNNTAYSNGNSLVTVVDESAPTVVSPEVDGFDVTFRYYAPDATAAYLAGAMNGWSTTATPMTKADNGVFEVTLTLEEGSYEYKFVVDGDWYTDPNNTVYSNGNSVVKVVDPNGPTIVSPEVDGLNVTFRYYAPDATKVCLAGTMNGWSDSATLMTKGDDGVWTHTAELAAGTYQYKFVVDGSWVNDPNNTNEMVDGNNTVTVVDESAPEVVSPEVDGTSVTFRYYAPDAAKVYLAGDMNGWNQTGTLMTKGEDGIWTYTTTLEPKKYGYKFIADGKWTADPENLTNPGDYETNSYVVVSGLISTTASVTRGEASELPAQLDYVDADGNTSKVNVTYTLADESLANYVTFDTVLNNKITVLGTYTGDEIEFTATAEGGATATVIVSIYDVQYTYTIYAYSEDASRMSLTGSALYVWDPVGGTLEAKDYAFMNPEVLSDGNTWLKTEITLGCTNLGMIFKSAGSWSWQTADMLFTNTEKKNCTLYVIDGHNKVYESLDEIPSEDEKRYLVVEYTNADNNYTDMKVYSWANGFGEVTYDIELVNGKYIAKIPVADSETEMSVGFIVKRGDTWDYKEGGDNFATFPADQQIVKVKFADAKVTGTYPYNTGAEFDRDNNKVNFYYRDDKLFLENNLSSLEGKVNVVLKSSTGNSALDGTHAMTYDAANDRFTCSVDLVAETDYYYYYSVDGKAILDAFNENTITVDNVEYSKLRNKTYALDMTASIANATMDYNENNLLSVDWTGKDGESLEGFVVKELYADLTELGLGNVAIDPELKTVTISCDQSVTAGEKTITVTLKDDCDMTYTTQATVKVTERVKEEGDFDWDEAVIYFAVTDRFFDGNTSNNTLVDTADTTDGSRYHGGDLAGLTEKIDYLYELGVNTIWLTPIVDNIDEDVRADESATDGYESYGYHGYWASDFTKLNPHLGTEEELKALIEAAHAKDMKIMVDVVLNHAGYETEEYFNGILDVDMIRGIDNTVAGDDKLSSLSGLPDFVTEDEEVRNQLIEWQTAWMENYDIDYYRVDTVKHVESTTWSAFKNALTESNPEFKLIGEYYGANYTNSTSQLNAGTMDSLLDFGFKDYAKSFVLGNLLSVETTLAERNDSLGNAATLGQFLSSHDETGLLTTLTSACGNNAELAKSLMKVAASLQITAKGQPVIYYGEEIGLTGENNYPQQTNRYDFDWDALAEQQADENSFYNHYKTMLNIRKEYSKVFAKGDRNVVQVSDADGYDVVRRTYDDTNIYVALNVKATANEVTFTTLAEAGSVYTDLYSDTEYTVAEDGSVTITIPSAAEGGTAVLVLTEGKESEIVDTNEITVKLHYNRPDGNYEGWDAWMWGDKIGGAGYEFVEEGGDMVATIKVPGRSESKVNYIIRLGGGDWKAKDVDADQSIDISDIVSGTVHFYVESGVPGGTRLLGADAIKGSKVLSSMYNRDTNTVTVVTSTPVTGDADTAFAITRYDGVAINITKVEVNDCTYTLTLEQDLTAMSEMLKEYTLRYDNFNYSLGMPSVYSSDEFENKYTYTGDDLGATWSAEATAFKVWAPTAEKVQVALYTSGTEGTDDLIKKVDMTPGNAGVWSAIVDGDLNGVYYTYFVTVNGETEEACDPYARTTGVNGKRAMVINLDSTDPEGWDEDVSPNKDMNYTDAVIYELHVRDASIHESSGVSAANKGKFLGLTETGTTTSGGVSTALDHISDLGVTHVHLLPVYDYGSVDETRLDEAQFNWGYDPVNYNVPEGSYSTDPYNGEVRVKEMKEMVMTLHENNINVIMDVVYNHVYDAETFCFNEIVPKYFSRTYADGSYVSGSGCGNDTASERAMVQKYIIDSVMYWAEEYHIDGFRFDLVGLIDTETMNAVIEAVHEKYPDIIFYGEGWEMAQGVTKENVSMATQKNAYLTPELAYFSDTIRNLLAGDNNAVNPGYVSGLTGQEEAIADCYTATTSWCPDPVNTVNYASCHDNYTLMDKLNKSRADASEADRIKMNNLAAAIYMMSEGIPFIHAGEEFLRTKIDETGEVIHNSYNSSDYVNALRWSNIENEKYADVVDYYKGLIEFRKNHESLRLTTKEEVAANVTYHWVSSDVVLFSIKGKASVAGEASDGIVVIFNPTTSAKSISLYDYSSIAEGEWKVCINGEDAGTDVLATITDGNVTVDPISAMVLVMGETVDTDSVYLDNYQEPDTDEPGSDTDEPGSDPDEPDTDTPGGSNTDNTPNTGGSSSVPTTPSEPEDTTTSDNEKQSPSKEEVEEPKETVEILIPIDSTIEEKTEAIVEAVEEVAEGNDVVVKVIDAESQNAEVSIEVFVTMEEHKEKDVDLVIELSNGFTWTISADSIVSAEWTEGLDTIDFWVEIVEEVIPTELVESVVMENQTAMEISLKHNGPFGLTAALDVPVGTEFAGRDATLYYFNTETNAMEEQATAEIREDGNVRYLFTHASDYVIVIAEAEGSDAGTESSENSTEVVEDTESVETEVPAEENSILPIIVVLVILLAACGGVILYLQKKKANVK
ncbi:MAG: type I pullulanase [Roseburia sp.]|nr:type I pullulanase [Roseburia sp.]